MEFFCYSQFQKYVLKNVIFQQTPEDNVLKLTSILYQPQVASSVLKPNDSQICQEENQHFR